MKGFALRRVCPAVVVGLLWTIAISSVPAQGAEGASTPDLSSPRATFGTFLSAMVAYHEGDSARIDDAVATLDTAGISSRVRREAGQRIARDLKSYLDRVEYIDLETIPDEVDGNAWVYRRTSQGEVSLTRTADGRWLFSAETVETVPDLLESVRSRPVVPGVEDGASQGLAGWVRARVPESMLRRVFILENWQWIALILLAFLGVVVDWTIRLTLGRWIRKLLTKSERVRQQKVDSDFARPIGIFFMALAWWALFGFLDLPVRALTALTFATQIMMAGAGVWSAYRLVDLVAAHFQALSKKTDTKVDDILVPMVRRALKIVVVAFGVLFIAQNLDIDITSLLAGLGIGGIAFALAAKDTVENLFGSFTVLVDRPFQIGDWVVIDGLEGTVEELGFRSTRIRTFYNSLITVPNATLVNAAVDNLGVRTYRRVKTMISVQYDTTPDAIEAFCEGIRELIRRHPYTRKDYYMVYLNEFAASSLDVLLYAFFRTPDWTTELRERHRLFVDIVRLAHRLGVQFAFPTRTLHVASMPPSAAGSETGGDVAADPIRFGRAEADAIVAGHWGEGKQRPVSFEDPDAMPPGAEAGGSP